MRASALPAFGDLTWRARQGRTRQHGVLAGDPSLAAVAHELRDGFFDRRGADDARVADFDEHRSFSGGDEIGRENDGTKLLGRTIVGAIEHDGIVTESLAAPEPLAIKSENILTAEIAEKIR